MKIIERGVLPESKEYRATCRVCGTVFSFLPIEASPISDQRDGDCYAVNCPLCSNKVYVNK